MVDNIDTPTPIVYKLTLNCAHEQLTTYPYVPGHHYPCWVACNPETPVKRTVIAVDLYTPDEHTAIVVASKLTNEEMLHIHRTVDVVNQQL